MNVDFLKTSFTRKMASKFFLLRKGIPRSFLAMKFLRGQGIEIGALHNPVFVGPLSNSKYVDRMSTADLVREYPELAGLKLANTDIVDNGEELSTIAADSLDFIIANHFIEHCENPIRTIHNFTQKLRPKGKLFLAVPDKRYTFDRQRPSTTFEHLVKDYELGPQTSREAHYLEWSTFTSPTAISEVSPEEVRRQAESLLKRGYSIHFHVWNKQEFQNFLAMTILRHQLPLRLVATHLVADEGIFILEKISYDAHSV